MLPWILCGILLVIVIALLLKIYFLKKDMNEICAALTEHLSADTNTLITISTTDRTVRHFAVELNKQLRLLRKQRQQYLSGEQELKDAVINISHDLRTPLTAICGYLELLEQEEVSPATQRYLEIISNRVALLEQLTEELFRYSVIIAADTNAVQETVILNQMLEESIAEFYVALKEHDIVPDIQLSQKPVIRYLDRSALSRVFSNILTNAIKYSDGDLKINLSEAGTITFTNTATGLNQVQVGRLFDRFYTVNSARKSTGLGLGIARTLVKQMNGTVSAAYEDDQLSIKVRLPKVVD